MQCVAVPQQHPDIGGSLKTRQHTATLAQEPADVGGGNSRVLQRVAVRCSALQCVAVRCNAVQCVAVH